MTQSILHHKDGFAKISLDQDNLPVPVIGE